MFTRLGKRMHEYIASESPENEANTTFEPDAKRAKNTPKILDGKFFTIEKRDGDSIVAVCCLCKEEKKGNINSTGNFITHFKSKHDSHLNQLKEHLKKITSANSSKIKADRQLSITETLQNTSSDTIALKLVDFIVDGNLSFNVAQLPSLRSLLETVSGRKLIMPTRHKFMSILNSQFNKVKTELKERLALQKFLCMTADVWTSHAQSYLGVTVHFLNDKYERESYLLAFKQLKKKQTYDILAKALDGIFKDYGIKTSQITNIVTDGGSAFCKMFKQYGDTIDVVVLSTEGEEIELAHDENPEIFDNPETNEIAAANTSSGTDVVQQFMLDENGEEFINEVLTLDEENSRTDTDEANFDNDYNEYFVASNPVPQPQSNEIKLPPQRRCVSHLLNLLANDFEKNLDGLAKTAFKKTLDALHTIWLIVRTSARGKIICKEILGCSLMYPCETRWNSKLDCIKQVNKPEIQPKLNALIQTLKSGLTSNSATQLRLLSSNDFIVMAQYEKVFGPVAQALDMLQGEYNNSQGLIFPVLRSMKIRIFQLEESNNIIRDFKAVILKLIDTRFGKYFDYNSSNKDFILSAVSHPRFKSNFISSNEDKIFVKNLLISECKKLCNDSDNEIEHVEDNQSSPQEDDFIILVQTNQNTRRNSIDNQIENEVGQFFVDMRKENNILNEYRYIRTVFYKYNTTLSSSAPVERVFSQSQMIFTPRRNRISPDNFEKTLILKHNRMLIDKAINSINRRVTN